MSDAALRERLAGALSPTPFGQEVEPLAWKHMRDVIGRDTLAEAAVLLGVIPRPEGLQVLLTLRHGGLRRHAGQVSLPGGRIDPEDAGAWAAALREAQEEVGLQPAQAERLGYLEPLATVSGFRVQPVVALLAADFVAVPQPEEVADAFEAPLSYLLARSSRRRYEVDWHGRPRPMLEYLATDDYAPPHRIWGVTAAILAQLARRLETP